MASLLPNPMKISVKWDTGELKGGKTVFRTSSLGGIKSSTANSALGDIATAFAAVLPGSVELYTLTATSELRPAI